MTKITAVGPRGGCPRFLAFLDRITGGDGELVSYLQRVLGCGLTGLTREHTLFFGYGTGANGKSVLLSTVAGILGDYHRSAPIETFTASSGDRLRPISPAFAARASSRPRKPKRAGAGPSPA
jgi:putative DNA primase/helicase